MTASAESIIRVNPFVVNLRDAKGRLSPTVTVGFHRYGNGRQGMLSPLGVKAENEILEAAYDKLPLIEVDQPGFTAHGDSQQSLLLSVEGLGRLANNDTAKARQDNGLGDMRRVGLVAVTGTLADLAQVRPIKDVLTLCDGGREDDAKPPILVAKAKGNSSVDTYLSMYVVSLGCGLAVPARLWAETVDSDEIRSREMFFTADPRPQSQILGSARANFGTVPLGPRVPAIGNGRVPLGELVGVS